MVVVGNRAGRPVIKPNIPGGHLFNERVRMPTRRIMELVIVTGLLMRPAFGLLHLEARKLLNEQAADSLLHAIAEIGIVVLS